MTRAVAAAAGVVASALVLGAGHPPPAVWPALAALLAAAATIGATHGRLAAAGPAAVAATIGAIAIAARLAIGPGAPPPVAIPDGAGPWSAVVEAVAAPRDGEQPATLRLADGQLRIAATLPRFPQIEPGDTVTVAGAFRPPTDDAYGAYLRRTGIAATLRSRTLERQPGPVSGVDLERLRRGAADALTRAIPEPEAGLAAGILIGLRDRVDRDLTAAFTTAGASHVVAISGWNIAIVAASVAAVGGRFGRRRRSVLTMVAIAIYVAFVGPTASVLRAAAMAAVVLLARESGRAGRATSGLAWAAVVILLLDPTLVVDPGFQLSSLATAGLLAWATPLSARIHVLGRGRLPGWLVENLGVSLAAQFATLPIVLGSFGRLSLVAPAVNLLVVPFVAPAMAAGAVALAAGTAVVFGAPALVATLAGLPAWVSLGWIVGVVRAGAGLPFASIALAPPADTIAAGVAAGLVLVVAVPGARRAIAGIVGRLRDDGAAPRRTRAIAAGPASGPVAVAQRRETTPLRQSRLVRGAGLALAASVLATALVFVHRPDGTTRITVLDVGQGDGILVEGGRGSRLLVDGGPDADRLLVALDERLPPWDRRLDAVVLTHPHEDHVAGLALLLSRYRVGRVYEPGMRGPGPGYAAWSRWLGTNGPPSATLATGDRFALDDIAFHVLWPDPGTVRPVPPDTGTAINNVSIVLLGDVAGRRFLLAGDIEEGIDPVLLRRGLPAVDVLKVAHHGSRTSSTNAFLDAVRPALAVVSVGAKNTYGHPAPATIDRLAAHGARVLRTDTDGTIAISIRPENVTVRTTGARRADLPPAVATASPPGRNAAAAFACGISPPALATTAAPLPVATRGPDTPDATTATAIAWRSAAASRMEMRVPGRDPSLLYHRPDDGPRAGGRRRAAPVPRPTALVHAAFARCRGGRFVARDADRGDGNRRRSAARRSSRSPP